MYPTREKELIFQKIYFLESIPNTPKGGMGWGVGIFSDSTESS